MRSQEDEDDYGSRPPLLIMPIQTGSSSGALGAYPGLIRNNSLIQSCDGEHGQGSTNEGNKGMVHGSSAQQQDDIMMDTDDNTRCGDLGTGSASKALPGPLYGPDMELIRRRLGAPPPPRSPYYYFCVERKPEVLHMLGESAEPQEVVRQLLHEWSTCPESQKGPWVAKALYDRERYCRDMAGAEFGHCKASRLIETGRSASGTLSDRVWDVSSLLSLSYTLHDVAADGNLRALRKMLETTEANCVDARDAEGLTPLHLATMCADYAAVEMLLRHGADPCMCVRGGMSALHLAAVKDVSMVLAMLDLAHTQTQILMQDDEGRTPLHWAAMGGRVDCVEALLERGAAPDVLDALDCTPLDMAVGERVPDIVEIESLIRRACSKRKSPLPLSCLDVEHLQRKKPRAGSADDDTGSARGHRGSSSIMDSLTASWAMLEARWSPTARETKNNAVGPVSLLSSHSSTLTSASSNSAEGDKTPGKILFFSSTASVSSQRSTRSNSSKSSKEEAERAREREATRARLDEERRVLDSLRLKPQRQQEAQERDLSSEEESKPLTAAAQHSSTGSNHPNPRQQGMARRLYQRTVGRCRATSGRHYDGSRGRFVWDAFLFSAFLGALVLSVVLYTSLRRPHQTT